MIIPLKKYLFLGAKEDLSEFFSRAQDLGFVEFISSKTKKPLEPPKEVKELTDAIKILRKQPLKTPYLGGGDLKYAHETAQHILGLKAEIEKLAEEQRFLEAEISRVGPFGDFSFDDVAYIENQGKRKIQFFCMKTSKSRTQKLPEEMIHVATVYDLDYFIAINTETKSYPEMIEMRFDRPLGELKNYLAFVFESLHQLEAELKGFAGHIQFLKESLVKELDIHFLSTTKKDVSFPIEDHIFSIEAWVPENKLLKLLDLVNGLAVHCEPILVDSQDRVPTCIENKGLGRIGEDLVRIYDIPAHRDRDPSLWVLWSFALFFAMIIADAGYGLIYLGIALFLKWKFPPQKELVKRFYKMSMILSTSCVVWGVLIMAFFGIEFKPDSPMSKFSLLQYVVEKKADYHFKQRDDVYVDWTARHQELTGKSSGTEMIRTQLHGGKEEGYPMLDEFSDNILLEVSLLIGVIHICLSLMRYLPRSWSHLGWICFIIGGYLYFPTAINATSLMQFLGGISKDLASTAGLQLVYSGMVIAAILALIQKRLQGISEIMHVIQVFADILSYLRLYALALASTMMAKTFNDLGGEVGLVFGGILILLGHGVNLLLGTMSGVIHGLRLNFIEWYHYSFEGGGKLFNPLRRLLLNKD